MEEEDVQNATTNAKAIRSSLPKVENLICSVLLEDEDEEENIKEAKPLLVKDVQNETLATEEIQGNVNNNTNCRKFGKGQATFYF